MALTKFNFNSFDVTTAASKGLGFNASANGFSTINPGAMTLIKTLTVFNPSSTTFVKHFIYVGNSSYGTYTDNHFIAGYFNTTTAITRFQFKMQSGNIDSGTIKLYGVS